MGSWRYGRAHQARFRHLLSALDPRTRWETPPIPMDGDNATPSVGPSRLPWSTEVGFGPVFRHVADLADSTQSWGVIPPWNSAAFPPEGALALQTPWRRHGYVPFLLDRARIEQQAHDRTTLTP